MTNLLAPLLGLLIRLLALYPERGGGDHEIALV